MVQLLVEAIDVKVEHVIRVVQVAIISTIQRLTLIVLLGQAEAVLGVVVSSQFAAFDFMLVISLRFGCFNFLQSVIKELEQILLDNDLCLHFLQLVWIQLIVAGWSVV